ncbi:hypothetical protein HDU76_009013, partial [Blyttiomyces sp. JEL0837]
MKKRFQYIVIPTCDADLNTITLYASHEISEVISDPLVNAFRGMNDGVEVGDVCEGEVGEIR